eukprot:61551_1
MATCFMKRPNNMLCISKLIVLLSYVSGLDTNLHSIEINSDATQIKLLPTFNKIALLFALIDEAKPIINEFDLKLSSEFNMLNPMSVYSNSNGTIFVICNGIDKTFNVHRIGTQAAAINAWLTIEYIKPDLVLSVGISGAIINEINNKKINIGDVFIAKKVMYHDRRVNIKPWNEGWNIGMYKTFNIFDMINNKDIKYLRNDRNIIVSTGNSFPECSHDHKIWKLHDAHLTEMECAAIAEVCLEKNVKFAAIKGVSNYVSTDNEGVEEFENHLALSVNQLGSVIIDIIKQIIDI